MSICKFCGHIFQGEKCDICGTELDWTYLKNNSQIRQEQKALADQGDVKASLRIGQYLHNQRDFSGCLSYLYTAADAGEADAEALLGQIYYNGQGTTAVLSESLKWHTLAAEHGNADSQFDMGLFYAMGEGVAKDEKKGFEYFEKAAAQGHVQGIATIGKLYFQGHGVKEDRQKAIECFERAASMGDEDCKRFLGMLMANGDYPSPEKQIEELLQKAKNGDAEALIQLGCRLATGNGIAQDTVEAVNCFLDAAKQGNAKAQT